MNNDCILIGVKFGQCNWTSNKNKIFINAKSKNLSNCKFTKSAYGSIDRASACAAEGLGFDSYWAQVSVGGFLDSAHLSLLPPWGTGMICPHVSEKKKTPHPNPALCRIMGVSFTFTFTFTFTFCFNQYTYTS